MIADPSFYLAAIPAVFLNSLSKGGFGGAFGGISVPLLAMTVAPAQAAAIMLPLLCAADIYGLRRYRGQWHAGILRTMILGGLLGVALGALSFGRMSPDALRLVVGGIAVAFSLHHLLGEPVTGRALPGGHGAGWAWASLSGYTSFVAHAGGPPAMAYLIPKGLDRAQYVATINGFFMVMNLIKVPPYAALGQFDRETLTASALLLPLVPIGVSAGFWLQSRIDNQRFYRIAQWCLLLSGVHLIFLALRGA